MGDYYGFSEQDILRYPKEQLYTDSLINWMNKELAQTRTSWIPGKV
ncbi:hypothetical protein [Siminovitchia sp. 179-K 8D1 HS]